MPTVPLTDARSDIYSLATVAYEMIAGEPPHTGPTAQAIFARVLGEEPRSISAIRPNVPVHVDDALQCALSKAAPRTDFRARVVCARIDGQRARVGRETCERASHGENRLRLVPILVAAVVLCFRRTELDRRSRRAPTAA